MRGRWNARWAVRAALLVVLALLVPAAVGAGGAVAADDPVAVTVGATGVGGGSGSDSSRTGDGERSGDASGDDSSGSGGASDEDSNDSDLRLVAVAFIAFALLTIVAVLIYLGNAQAEFFRTARLSIQRLGSVPKAVNVAPFARAGLAREKGVTLEIVGPAVLTVGGGGEFTAKLDGEEVAAAWSAEPARGISFDPATGAASTATASKAGAYRVIAAWSDGNGRSARGEAIVVAVEPAGEGGRLPLLGAGYGTVVVAIVATAGVATLGLLDVLGGEAVATFFGGLLGYIFLKGAAAAGSDGGGRDQGDTSSGAGTR